MKKITLFIIVFTFSQIAIAGVNPRSESHISKMLDKSVPYHVKVLNYDFVINNVDSYPPGKLTAMFAEFLIANNLLKNKIVADIGAGCFGLGIIAAKNGANIVVGTDINKYAISCAKDNLVLNNVTENAYLYQGAGVSTLFPNYIGKIDILVSGLPWDSITSEDFAAIPNKRKLLSRAFYDIDNDLLTDIMSEGFKLLSPKGRMFITSSKQTISRVKEFCLKYKIAYKIVKEADLHKDGNIYYIVELIKHLK